MKKRKRILLVLLTLAAAGGLLWLMLREPAEPSYQGKPLSVWLESYMHWGSVTGAWPNPETDEAIRQIGTNAIPTLLKMLNARDSKWKFALAELSRKQDFVRIKLPLSWWGSYVPTITAAQGFVALGASASNAVPQLIEIFRKNAPQSQLCSVIALGSIGPAARQAIPDLLSATTNLYRDTRLETVKALGNLHAEPAVVVPALIKCLQDPDPGVRRASVRALAKFGPEAKPAVPALTQLTGDPLLATNANDALKSIDPEASAKAGIK